MVKGTDHLLVLTTADTHTKKVHGTVANLEGCGRKKLICFLENKIKI